MDVCSTCIPKLFPSTTVEQNGVDEQILRFENLAFVGPAATFTLQEVMYHHDDVSLVSGNEFNFPLSFDIETDEFVDQQLVVKQVHVYKEKFDIVVDDKTVDANLLNVPNDIGYSSLDAILTIVKSLSVCKGVASDKPVRLMRAKHHSSSGYGVHSVHCNKLVSLLSSDDACRRCINRFSAEAASSRRKSEAKSSSMCPDIMDCIKKEAIYVSGSPQQFPIHCCVVDVQCKIDGRYVTKEIRFYDDRFTLIVDGRTVNARACGVNSQLSFTKHHQIIKVVRSLRVCQGVETPMEGFIERLHEGTGPKKRGWHSMKCNIVRPSHADSSSCDKCALRDQSASKRSNYHSAGILSISTKTAPCTHILSL